MRSNIVVVMLLMYVINHTYRVHVLIQWQSYVSINQLYKWLEEAWCKGEDDIEKDFLKNKVEKYGKEVDCSNAYFK